MAYGIAQYHIKTPHTPHSICLRGTLWPQHSTTSGPQGLPDLQRKDQKKVWSFRVLGVRVSDPGTYLKGQGDLISRFRMGRTGVIIWLVGLAVTKFPCQSNMTNEKLGKFMQKEMRFFETRCYSSMVLAIRHI